MQNIFLSYPNFSDVTDYATPVISGGSWLSDYPLSNVQHPLLARVARSSDVTLASTKLHVDLGAQRDVRRVVLPVHNMSRTATVRVRATRTIGWSGVVVSASALEGASSISVSGTAEIAQGDTFTIAGDDTVYSATAALSLSGSGTLSLSPVLTGALAGSEVITCRVGDYTDPALDTGWENVWQILAAFGSLTWGSAGLWTGTLSEEQRAGCPVPYRARTGYINVRYLLIEIDDQSNAAGYVELARLFVSRGIQPSRNFSYGATLGWENDTTSQRSLKGANFFDVQTPRRVLSVTNEHIDHDEAMSQFFDMARQLGKDGQVYIEMDPDDTANLHRRAFLATIRDARPVDYTSFGRNRVIHTFEEVTS